MCDLSTFVYQVIIEKTFDLYIDSNQNKMKNISKIDVHTLEKVLKIHGQCSYFGLV